MTCTVCGQAHPVPGTATVTLERDGATLVMKDVPALVCPNCGEEYVSDDVATRVTEIADRAFREGITVDVRHYAGAA